MFRDKYQIKPKTNKIFYQPDVCFHEDKIKYLYELGNDSELPNLLFYGDDGCGKHTLVKLLLYYLFGKDIFNTEIESYNVNTNNNTTTPIEIKQSKHHMVFYPHNNNFDKYMIQYILKTFIQSNSFGYEKEKNKFKIIVINNVEKLNYLAQMSLRRTMEEYSDHCRFIFICKSISNVIDPLKSRCVSHRIENPSNDELMKLALRVLLKEKKEFKINDIKDLIEKSENNVNKMLFLLDLYSIDANIDYVYSNNVFNIVKLIKTTETYNYQTIKDIIYNLIITNVSVEKIMYDIMKTLIRSIEDMNVVSKIIKCGIKHNKLLSNSRRHIIVFNSFIFNLMECLS